MMIIETTTAVTPSTRWAMSSYMKADKRTILFAQMSETGFYKISLGL